MKKTSSFNKPTATSTMRRALAETKANTSAAAVPAKKAVAPPAPGPAEKNKRRREGDSSAINASQVRGACARGACTCRVHPPCSQ